MRRKRRIRRRRGRRRRGGGGGGEEEGGGEGEEEEVTVRRAEYDLQQQVLYSSHRRSSECIAHAYLSLFVSCHRNMFKRNELEEKQLSSSLSRQ